MKSNWTRRVLTFVITLIAVGVGVLAGLVLMITLIMLLWARAA